MNLKTLMAKAEEYNNQYLELKALLEKHTGSRNTYTDIIEETGNKIKYTDSEIDALDKVSTLLQMVLDNSQNQVGKIETICSDALQSVLNDSSLKFKIRTEKKKVNIDTDFFIEDSKAGDVDVMKGEAGGTKNTIAVALRLIFSELYKPKIEGPIILDEAGGNISADHQASFGRFLNKFSQAADRQIILITHHMPVIEEADCKINVSKRSGESIIV